MDSGLSPESYQTARVDLLKKGMECADNLGIRRADVEAAIFLWNKRPSWEVRNHARTSGLMEFIKTELVDVAEVLKS